MQVQKKESDIKKKKRVFPQYLCVIGVNTFNRKKNHYRNAMSAVKKRLFYFMGESIIPIRAHL